MLDAKDNELLQICVKARQKHNRPLVGDFVKFESGEVERISHDWGDEMQTSKTGSFYLFPSGRGDFSGALNPSIPVESMTLIDELDDGAFWFFHHGIAGAGRGVHFHIPVRVWKTNAPYDGFQPKK